MSEKKEEKLTQERLKEVLDYNPLSGKFTWKVMSGYRVKVGDTAGSKTSAGYIQIKVDNKKYLSHRLAYLYMAGYFPEYQVDHKRGVRDDNRWSELRHVTVVCNHQNQKVSSNNNSGFPGVSCVKGGEKWKAEIQIRNNRIYLGYHPSSLDAALARLTFEIQCSDWTCNYRSELVKSIKEAWPEFPLESIGE